MYPAYDAPILDWRPSLFESAFVALHPFEGEETPRTWAHVSADLDVDIGRLNRALLTSVGALRVEFEDAPAASRLKDYCLVRKLDFPQDGQFPVQWTELLTRFLREHGSGQVWVRSEFGDTVVLGHGRCRAGACSGQGFEARRGLFKRPWPARHRGLG
jgi:hypothetical protein